MEAKIRTLESGSVEPQGEDLRNRRDTGIDLTMIRWMLSLTPAGRLRVLQQAADSLQKLRHANPIH